jgi:putative phosphonate metabolism protein
MSVVATDAHGMAGNDNAQWSTDARFAVYYAPARTSAWWQAGCEWLGGDVETGITYSAPQPPAVARATTELTHAPRRYGWHGTLIAPFRLADGVTSRDTLDQARAWAIQQNPFVLPVEAATLGDFVALRPATEEGETSMRALASSALRELTHLRATPSAADLARRLAAPLTERQRELLVEWGYPYVFDEFRFHMTLSSSLAAAEERTALVQWWHERIAQLGPLVIESAALFVEPAAGEPFVLWQRLPFQAGGMEKLEKR